jgi:AraC-like DNA-binding protein
VESVARAHGVSVRYLHKALAPTGSTLSAWIRRQRLERVCRDLVDESLRARTASAIAARWGITDTDHLSRALKAEFGMTAGEIRRSGRWDRGGPRTPAP